MKNEARIAELRKNIFQRINDLDYWKDILELRRLIIEDGGNDIFLPKDPTEEDYQAVEKTIAIVNKCMKYADGNSRLFTIFMKIEELAMLMEE